MTTKTHLKTSLMVLFFSILQLNAQDQSAPYHQSNKTAHVCPKIEKAEYPQGAMAFQNDILKRLDLKKYQDPKRVHDTTLSFLVSQQGRISRITCKGSSPAFDEAVERAVNELNPIFKPGTVANEIKELFYTQSIVTEEGPVTEALFEDGIDAFRAVFVEKAKKINIAYECLSNASFTILPQGTLANLKVEGSNQSFNQEIERSIKSIKKQWQPAVEDGKNVSSEIKIPFKMRF